jgi:hypothetical protein
MPVIEYVPHKFSQAALAVIARANGIVDEYSQAGYSLTLRQLYYQFVARGWLPNRQTEYDRLGGIINDARLAGMLDWHAIEDRTRWLRVLDSDSGTLQEHLAASAGAYAKTRWRDQPYAPEVWIEKDALVGIAESACTPLYVPYFACRGYASQSEVWAAGQRMIGYRRQGRTPVVFHLGDHDPSGIDMTRDLQDRLQLFCSHHGYQAPDVVRLALNMEQVEEHEPPPNPAKLSDSRAQGYIATYGEESWELDALPPDVLAQLITDAIEPLVDQALWRGAEEAEAEAQAQLRQVAQQWDRVQQLLAGKAVPPPGAIRDIDGGWQ